MNFLELLVIPAACQAILWMDLKMHSKDRLVNLEGVCMEKTQASISLNFRLSFGEPTRITQKFRQLTSWILMSSQASYPIIWTSIFLSISTR